jgi:hypothetical protein
MTTLFALPKLAMILAMEMFNVEMSMTAGQVIWFFLIIFFLGFFLGMLYAQFTYKPKEKK